jgi:hypothetical protein
MGLWKALFRASRHPAAPRVKTLLNDGFFRTALEGLPIRSEKEQRANAFNTMKAAGYLLEDESDMKVFTLSNAIETAREKISQWDDFQYE